MAKEYKVAWVDPPEGWMYGFPKDVDEAFHLMGRDKTQWFLDNGYPQNLIDKGMLKYSRSGLVEVVE